MSPVDFGARQELSTFATGGVHPLKLFDTPTPAPTEGLLRVLTPLMGRMLFSARRLL